MAFRAVRINCKSMYWLTVWDAQPSWIVVEARYDANAAMRDAVLGNES